MKVFIGLIALLLGLTIISAFTLGLADTILTYLNDTMTMVKSVVDYGESLLKAIKKDDSTIINETLYKEITDLGRRYNETLINIINWGKEAIRELQEELNTTSRIDTENITIIVILGNNGIVEDLVKLCNETGKCMIVHS